MTQVLTIEQKEVALDGKIKVPAIFLNDNYFAHYIETGIEAYLLPDSDGCPCCAYMIAIKNAGDYVIIMPVFSRLKEFTKDVHLTSYPYLNYPIELSKDGILYFTKEQYQTLCGLLLSCPPQDQLLPLTKSDAAHIVWWDAPFKDEQFGISESLNLDFSLTPKITREFYLATTAPEGKQILAILENVLKEYSLSNDPVTIVPSKQDISIVLDTPDYYEWKPLCPTPEAYSLQLEPGLQVQTTTL